MVCFPSKTPLGKINISFLNGDQLKIDIRLGMGFMCLFRLKTVMLYLVQTCTGCMQASTVLVSSYVYFNCILQVLFPVCLPSPSFCLLFNRGPVGPSNDKVCICLGDFYSVRFLGAH